MPRCQFLDTVRATICECAPLLTRLRNSQNLRDAADIHIPLRSRRCVRVHPWRDYAVAENDVLPTHARYSRRTNARQTSWSRSACAAPSLRTQRAPDPSGKDPCKIGYALMRCIWTPPQARLPSCMPSSADLWVAGTSTLSSPSGTYRHMHYHSGTTQGPFANGLGLSDRDSVRARWRRRTGAGC